MLGIIINNYISNHNASVQTMCDRDRDRQRCMKILRHTCRKSAQKDFKINSIDGVCNDECKASIDGCVT